MKTELEKEKNSILVRELIREWLFSIKFIFLPRFDNSQ